jgi:hypothetical protein
LKNQYFGDETDFKKYGILRELSKSLGEGIAVCWMLTPDDGTTEGANAQYTEKPREYRNCDPDLFDSLSRHVSNGSPRNVGLAQDVIKRPSVLFFDRLLPDNSDGRREYFEELKQKCNGQGLVFFDPDIGLAPASAEKGRRESSRYLFWDELAWFYFRMKQSVMVYQHFPRANRNHFVCDAVSRLMLDTRAPEVYSLRTNRMVFFIIPQDRHREMIDRACIAIARKWLRHIEVWQHLQPKRLT